ncbi:MAG: hypothetical protein DRH37_00020 [Deltaproteobacteria bacterium]|nr:MAG: hypothetical protein DRH37_00020 [Deltaproteobacteria bacterium]
MTPLKQLITLIRQQNAIPVPPGINRLTENLLARHGDAVQAVLFYGSCFRKGDDTEGIVDLYLLVDQYQNAYRRRAQAFLNKLLPPNVFYLELPYEEHVIRAKYAVFSLKDFRLGSSGWFHSYLWGRLAQPMGLVYAKDDQVAAQVYTAMARAVVVFVSRVLPMLPSRFTAEEFWNTGFSLTYTAELRAERQDALVGLFETAPAYYEVLTRTAIRLVPSSVSFREDGGQIRYHAKIHPLKRLSARTGWTVRRFQGKLLSLLRLLKGALTFENGLDYILWKIERHSGIQVELNPQQKRIPLVGVMVLFWRLYRRGAFR